MSNSPRQRPNFTVKSSTSVILIVLKGALCPVKAYTDTALSVTK